MLINSNSLGEILLIIPIFVEKAKIVVLCNNKYDTDILRENWTEKELLIESENTMDDKICGERANIIIILKGYEFEQETLDHIYCGYAILNSPH